MGISFKGFFGKKDKTQTYVDKKGYLQSDVDMLTRIGSTLASNPDVDLETLKPTEKQRTVTKTSKSGYFGMNQSSSKTYLGPATSEFAEGATKDSIQKMFDFFVNRKKQVNMIQGQRLTKLGM